MLAKDWAMKFGELSLRVSMLEQQNMPKEYEDQIKAIAELELTRYEKNYVLGKLQLECYKELEDKENAIPPRQS